MPARFNAFAFRTTWIAALSLAAAAPAWAQTSRYPVTPEQRQTADQVAQAGVPLSELSPTAPDSHLVKEGDTLWDISKLFLSSPWRWPELWGMNKFQISNPHLIYPGQLLVLVKRDGRARLELASPTDGSGGATGDAIKLKPRMRISALRDSAITAIPLNLIEPFLSEAVVFDTDALERAPRVVATQEGRVMTSAGELAYARGDFGGATDFRVFRSAVPLRDPTTKEVLGYEAAYVGRAELTRPESSAVTSSSSLFGQPSSLPVPATLVVRTVKQEVVPGDRLAPVAQRIPPRYVPHAPSAPITGQVIALYGDALQGGQNQIVSLNRGAADGLERGHVLALWRDGRLARDRTTGRTEEIKLPDERHGVLFVFEVFQRVSYALIVQVQEPVKSGDRFTQP